MECFYELSRYTQEHWEPRVPPAGMRQSASRGAGDGSKPEPVKVIEIKTVGAYEVAVLSARDAGSLANWLKANQFAIPKDKEAVIDAYIQQQWYFVAVKIDLNKAGGFQVVSGPPPAGGGRQIQREEKAGQWRTPAVVAPLCQQAMRVPAENFLRQRHPVGGADVCAVAVPALVTALQSTNPVVRIHAVSALDDSMGGSPLLQDPGVLDCLPALFQDPEPEVRRQAAEAAGSSRNPKFEEALVNLLRDPDEGVRHAAVFAVKRNYYGKSQSLPVLQKLLKDENLEVRASALESLGISGAPIPREDILPLLSVTNMRVVSFALSRLGRDGVSLDELEPLFHNRLMMARLAGLSFVERLGNNQEAIELILPLVRDPEQPVRGHAWKLLETLTGQTIPQDQPDRWEQWRVENKPALMLAGYTKAIAQDPKGGRAYHNRGCLHYNAHKFPEALADFRKARELGSDARDYFCFRLWPLQTRSGEKDEATRELTAYMEHRPVGKPDDWQSKVGRFLAGQMTQADLLKAAADPNAQTDREQHCEAYFYAGSKRLIEGDQTTAADYFKQCVATDVKKFEEYSSAVAELKLLPASPAK